MTFEVTNEGCPPHLIEAIMPSMEWWGWLVPVWVEFVRVVFDNDDPGTLKMRLAEEYRVIYVTVCCGWAKVREDEYDRWVMHELVHIHQNHVYNVLDDLLSAVTKEGDPLRLWATSVAARAVERGTNDLERILWNKFHRDSSLAMERL